MGDVLITERLSISNSTSRADNSGPLMSWKSPSYYGVLAFFRRVRESWEALFPPSSDGRAPSSSREAGGGGGSTPGCTPAPVQGDAGGGRERSSGKPGAMRVACRRRKVPGGPAGEGSRLRSPSHPSKGSASPLSSAAGISCYRKA